MLKTVLRTIGAKSIPNLNVFSGAEVDEYISKQYLANGYEVKNTHYLGEKKDPAGATMGYEVMYILVKSK